MALHVPHLSMFLIYLWAVASAQMLGGVRNIFHKENAMLVGNLHERAECDPLVANSCASGEYCWLPDGDCVNDNGYLVGECRPKSFRCHRMMLSVCGCDGNTYSNACMASSAGINIAYDGRCDGSFNIGAFA
mmetsp:Transcript_16811/g.35279  ORF Transcript_16811/g.35279 Transcript_16811/m.35279 type:complete len:132 (-) Transcript_16811:236-631(-)